MIKMTKQNEMILQFTVMRRPMKLKTSCSHRIEKIFFLFIVYLFIS